MFRLRRLFPGRKGAWPLAKWGRPQPFAAFASWQGVAAANASSASAPAAATCPRLRDGSGDCLAGRVRLFERRGRVVTHAALVLLRIPSSAAPSIRLKWPSLAVLIHNGGNNDEKSRQPDRVDIRRELVVWICKYQHDALHCVPGIPLRTCRCIRHPWITSTCPAFNLFDPRGETR